MIAALAAVLVLLLVGSAATGYLYRVRLPQHRRIEGTAQLSRMDWGDFLQLVLAVLNGRGFERSFGGSGTDGEYLMQRDGEDWLLSSRHSRAYTPSSTAIAEFGNHLRQRGVHGGILAIPGNFPSAAFGRARAQRVELLDASTMWGELQSLLNDEQRSAIEHPSRTRLRWQLVLAWLVALALAVAVYWLVAPIAPVARTPVAAQATPDAGAALALPTTPPVVTAPAELPLATTTLGVRRQAMADAMADLPHVVAAGWPTDSTLLVKVDSEQFDPRSALCPLLEADEALRASRLQIQYPAASDRPIRFLQCRAY